MSFPGPRGRFSLMCQAYLTPLHYLFDRVAGRSTIKRALLWQKADQRGTATLPKFLVVLLPHRGRSVLSAALVALLAGLIAPRSRPERSGSGYGRSDIEIGRASCRERVENWVVAG